MIYFTSVLADIMTLLAAFLFVIILEKQTKKNVSIILAIVTCIAVSLLMTFCYIQETQLYDGIALLLYPIRYLIVFSVAFGKFNLKKFYIVILYEFTINIFVSCITNLFGSAINLPFRVIASIVLSILNIFVIILLYILRRKISFIYDHIKHIMPKHLYILVLCSVLCLCALSTLNNYSTSNIKVKESIMNFIIISFTFITAWIILSLLVNVIAKQHLSNTSTMLQNQVEIQIRHYDKLEKLNNEMRSFKHDYTNHLYSLRSLIQMNENADAITYIEKLLNANQHSPHSFCTGNKLADAILTDKSDILNEKTKIDYQGIIPPTIDNLHLCIILTNALDNAIEACKELSSPSTISITAQERQGYFVMSIINPTAKNETFYDIPATSKQDSEHHGMGLTNIRNVVETYDGQMQVHCENHVFELSIALKL